MGLGAALLMGCVPPVDGVEETDGDTEGTSDDGGPLTTAQPATDSLSGTGMTPPGTDGTTSIGVDESGISTNGDDPDPSTTDPGGVSTSGDDDGTGSSDSDGTSTPVTTTDATDTSDTDDTSDVVCEEMPNNISCDALADSPSIFNAIGLGCEGDPSETIPLGAWTFPPGLDPASWAIASQFGSHVDAMNDPTFGPREGESFLVLSNGTLEPVEADGQLPPISLADSNFNSDDSAAPAPIAWPENVSDLVWFQVELEAPPGVTGFTLDVAFFSEEFPEWVGTAFNDALVVWAHTSVDSINVCMTLDGAPCTVTGLWPSAYQPAAEELVDTGFNSDGSTGWQTLHGPAVPGETLQLTVAVFDAGDTIHTTLALIDAFSWECDGCDGTPGNECGFDP